MARIHGAWARRITGMSNLVIATMHSGDRAEVRSYVHAVLDVATRRLRRIGSTPSATTTTIFVRTPDGWRIWRAGVQHGANADWRRPMPTAAVTGHDGDRFHAEVWQMGRLSQAHPKASVPCLADQFGRTRTRPRAHRPQRPLLDEVATGVRDRPRGRDQAGGLDLTVPDVGDLVADATDGLEVGLVIYNAGASDRIDDLLETERRLLAQADQAGLHRAVALARHFGPAMRDRGRGGIVLVASLACLAGSATLAVYSAVKPFKHNFAEGLWSELRPYGVDVCCTPLGMTYTPAFAAHGHRVRPAPRRCRPRTSPARSSSTSATVRFTWWGSTMGRRVAVWTIERRVARRDDERRLAGFRIPEERLLDAGSRLARRQTSGPRHGRSGTRLGPAAAADAERRDLRVRRALYGPPRPGRRASGCADSDRDIVMGHEFIGEVVGHGPTAPPASRSGPASRAAAAGSAMAPTARYRSSPGRPRRLRRALARDGGLGPRGVRRRPNDAVVLVDAFAVGEGYVRMSASSGRRPPARHRRRRHRPVRPWPPSPWRAASPRSSCRITVPNGWSTPRNSRADVLGESIRKRSPYDVWRGKWLEPKEFKNSQVIFECVGATGSPC